MEVTDGLRDEYSRINEAANRDVLGMYLNYDGPSEKSSLSSGYHSSDTPTLDAAYGRMVARDAIFGSAANAVAGRGINAGLGAVMSGQMPSMESVLDPTSLATGLAGKMPGSIMSGLGFGKSYNTVGANVGGILGAIAGGPVGGTMGSLLGRVGASGLMDALGLREEEEYLDFLEDEYGWFRAQQLYAQETDPNFRSYRDSVISSYYDAPAYGLAYDSEYTPDFMSSMVSPTTAAEYGMPYGGYELDFNYDITNVSPEAYLGAPVDSFMVDIEDLYENPALLDYYMTVSSTVGYDDNYDSTIFGYDIGQNIGGDLDPQGDRLGGLDSTW